MTNRPAWAEIDLDALQHNARRVQEIAGENKKIMAVVKANAYGHGAVPVVQALTQVGIRHFAVAITSEALELRQAGIREDILVLGWTPREDFLESMENQLTLCIFDAEDAQALHQQAMAAGKTARVHIKIDTGMSRIGFFPSSESLETLKTILHLPGLEVEGIFTHFAKADEGDKSFAQKQLERFLNFVCQLEKESGVTIPIKHAANSAGILEFSPSHLDMVRAGIILYGLSPSEEVGVHGRDFLPVMSLKARLSRVEVIPPGTSVSYGGRFSACEATRVGTIPVGYADGYNRLLSNRGEVIVHGEKHRLLGTVCMDQCMVELEGLPQAKAGDEVILMGYSGNLEESAGNIAAKIGTIPYEVVCLISPRIPRRYKGGGQQAGQPVIPD